MRLSGLLIEASWPEEWANHIITNSNFKQWLRSLGIDGEIGKPLVGGIGRAYPIGDRYIVKLTSSDNEANAAAVIKQHQSPHTAKVYDVRLAGTFPDRFLGTKNIWAIAMERLNIGVGKKFRMAANAVYSYLDFNPGFIKDVVTAAKTAFYHYIPNKYHKDKQLYELVKKVTTAIYDIQQQTGVLLQDPHGGNIAFKGRNPAFFDFGRSSIDPHISDYPTVGAL